MNRTSIPGREEDSAL